MKKQAEYNEYNEYMTVAEFARERRVSPYTVWALIRKGVLPPGIVIKFGRSIRISRTRLREDFESLGGKGLGVPPIGGRKRVRAA